MSKGIGLAITKTVLNNGGIVIVTSRDTQILLDKITYHKSNLLTLALDITNETTVKKDILKAIAQFDRIDVLLNNAGYNLLGNIEELSDTEFRKTKIWAFLP